MAATTSTALCGAFAAAERRISCASRAIVMTIWFMTSVAVTLRTHGNDDGRAAEERGFFIERLAHDVSISVNRSLERRDVRLFLGVRRTARRPRINISTMRCVVVATALYS